MELKRNILEGKLQPAVGVSDWTEFSQRNYCVDKTLFIKDIIDRDTRVALFTRPRRFGKTSTLEMVRSFFEKTDKDTSYLFTDKKIWAAGEKYRALQGKFPVIFLAFKDHKGQTWEDAAHGLMLDISSEIARHKEAVFSSKWRCELNRNLLLNVMNGTEKIHNVTYALKYLIEAIYAHTGMKPIVLIDDYDVMIPSASTYGYYRELSSFMEMFLGAMKDNHYLEMVIIMGVLRVVNKGPLLGLNLSKWTVFEPQFSEYFGFTEDEVREMAKYYSALEKLDEIKSWYGGYQFEETELYNPWSVVNYFDSNFQAKTYWSPEITNDLPTNLVCEMFSEMKEKIEKLLSGESVYVFVRDDLGNYCEIFQNGYTFFAFLISTGCLTIVSSQKLDMYYIVKIPNQEVNQYVHVLMQNVKKKDNEAHA